MNNEYADRQQAVTLRLAGHSVDEICRILGRSPAWFHIWWRRYRAAGPTSLLDLTRVNLQPRRITAELERTIVSIRQRLASQLHPGTRYRLSGANAILAELRTLEILPLPGARTLERVWQRNRVTLPKVRLAPYLSTPTYPVPHVTESNHLHSTTPAKSSVGNQPRVIFPVRSACACGSASSRCSSHRLDPTATGASRISTGGSSRVGFNAGTRL